jgi:hypothetical protein
MTEPRKLCQHCNEPAFGGCRECTRCWELSHRIDADPKWALHFFSRIALEPGAEERITCEKPSREVVLALALAAMVPARSWVHPAQGDAIVDVGRFFALVASGCEFVHVPAHTTETLLCFCVTWHGADWAVDAKDERENFWLPRPAVLVERPFGDWYRTREAGGPQSR